MNNILNLIRGSTTSVSVTVVKEDGVDENLVGFESATFIMKETIDRSDVQVVGVVSGITYSAPNRLSFDVDIPVEVVSGDYFGQIYVTISSKTYPSRPFKIRVIENLGVPT